MATPTPIKTSRNWFVVMPDGGGSVDVKDILADVVGLVGKAELVVTELVVTELVVTELVVTELVVTELVLVNSKVPLVTGTVLVVAGMVLVLLELLLEDTELVMVIWSSLIEEVTVEIGDVSGELVDVLLWLEEASEVIISVGRSFTVLSSVV